MGFLYTKNRAFDFSKLYLHDLFNSVQLKDIVKRNKIRDVDLLERIIAYVIANVGTTFATTYLANFLLAEEWN